MGWRGSVRAQGESSTKSGQCGGRVTRDAGGSIQPYGQGSPTTEVCVVGGNRCPCCVASTENNVLDPDVGASPTPVPGRGNPRCSCGPKNPNRGECHDHTFPFWLTWNEN